MVPNLCLANEHFNLAHWLSNLVRVKMVIILLSLISSQKGLPAQASLLGCLVMPSILDNGREKKNH